MPVFGIPTQITANNVASYQVLSVPQRVIYLSVTNNDSAPRYLMGFDATSLPSDGMKTHFFGDLAPIAAGGSIIVDASHHGLAVDHGLVLCFSTVPHFKAIAPAKMAITAWVA